MRVCACSTIAASSRSSLSHPTPNLCQAESRRPSAHYTKHMDFPENRQPNWINDKMRGIFSYERCVRHIYATKSPLRRLTHMNAWPTDTGPDINPYIRGYNFLWDAMHNLAGRKSSSEAPAADRRVSDAKWERETNIYSHGMDLPLIRNVHYETFWNQPLYRLDAHHGSKKECSDEEDRMAITVNETRMWWERLLYLVKTHGPAVGDYAPNKPRNSRHVHECFVNFESAITGFEMQSPHLALRLKETRPAELEDLFGVFLQIECNYVNPRYCPRCSLPYDSTQFCGEGDPFTPYRKFRGRYGPHKPWGREWFDVVANRAEQLWYKATEHPFFGAAYHTQMQAEKLLEVFCKTRQRGKASTFLTNLRGSTEYISGRITVTEEMQRMYDALLDSTSHPHLLTNSYFVSHTSAKYLGYPLIVPQSPLQFRIDMEVNKFRRWQRENGVVRVPPPGWNIDTTAIVPYKVVNKQIVNWREVKSGIEKSFAAPGLSKDSYTTKEWREMMYLEDRLPKLEAMREQYAKELDLDIRKLKKAHCFVFPDADFYRAFDTCAEALAPFGLAHGQRVEALCKAFPDSSHVPHTTSLNKTFVFDVRDESTRIYGFCSGAVLRLTSKAGDVIEAVVVGVDVQGAETQWELYAVNGNDHDDIFSLGADLHSIRAAWKSIEVVRARGDVTILDDKRTEREAFLGTVIGVRAGELYTQWDHGVAVCVGSPQVKKLWTFRVLNDGKVMAPKEPFSWDVPFRNDWSSERLQELKMAPWTREPWAPLIPNKYTPKPKRFGWTQFDERDDFLTKEYRDRLVSKQFFTSPQSFKIVPDAVQSTVNFGAKTEYTRLQGPPTVDRNELENGWEPASILEDFEVRATEQALRDISGRRPGNFLKRPRELNDFQLNEPWWKSVQWGWEGRNGEESIMKSPQERQMVYGDKLPFHGVLPPSGSTMGIAERIQGSCG